MPVVISVDEAKAFAIAMQRPDYARDERDYKVAVHAVFSRLLSPPVIDSPDFPRILKSTLDGTPDFDRLGFRSEERDAVVQATKQVGDFRNAFANLCGGRWGVAQYIWMLPAVDLDFGESLRAAFKLLVNTGEPVAGRVDAFRLELHEIQKQVRDKGGFKPGWSLLNVALGFVGAVLGAYDPARYTFYHATRLKRSIEHLGAEWPQGTAGHRYEGVCELVRQVGDALKTHGVPVRDLIDAQTFYGSRRRNLRHR